MLVVFNPSPFDFLLSIFLYHIASIAHIHEVTSLDFSLNYMHISDNSDKNCANSSSRKMAKRNVVVLLLVIAIIFSYNASEGGAHQSQLAFSGKVVNAEHKASFSGMSSL